MYNFFIYLKLAYVALDYIQSFNLTKKELRRKNNKSRIMYKLISEERKYKLIRKQNGH